jgi:hypothetical protein
MPKLSVYQEMVQNDWSKRMVMESINTYTEVATLATATTATYVLTTPFLAFKSHFAVRNVVHVAGKGINNFDINSFTMNLNGVRFCDNMPKSRMNSCAAKYGTSFTYPGVIEENGGDFIDDVLIFKNGILTIDWGVLCGRGQNSGTSFFQELQGTNISITFNTVTTAGDARLFVVHEVFNTLAYEPSAAGGMLTTDSNN